MPYTPDRMGSKTSKKPPSKEKTSEKTVDTAYLAPESIPSKLQDHVGQFLSRSREVVLEVYEHNTYKVLPYRYPVGDQSVDEVCIWAMKTARAHLKRCAEQDDDVPTVYVVRMDVIQGKETSPRRTHIRAHSTADGTYEFFDDSGHVIGGGSSSSDPVFRTIALQNESIEKYADIANTALESVADAAKNICSVVKELSNIAAGVAEMAKNLGAASAEVIRAETDRNAKAAAAQRENDVAEYDHVENMERMRQTGAVIQKVAEGVSPVLGEWISSKMQESGIDPDNVPRSQLAYHLQQIWDEIEPHREEINRLFESPDFMSMLERAVEAPDDAEARALLVKAFELFNESYEDKLDELVTIIGPQTAIKIRRLGKKLGIL